MGFAASTPVANPKFSLIAKYENEKEKIKAKAQLLFDTDSSITTWRKLQSTFDLTVDNMYFRASK